VGELCPSVGAKIEANRLRKKGELYFKSTKVTGKQIGDGNESEVRFVEVIYGQGDSNGSIGC
jgi:hypothetical protein